MSTLVHHARDTHSKLCDTIALLRKDARKAKDKLRRLFGMRNASWLRFAIVPDGTVLPAQLGNPDRPFASALKLDAEGLITEELIQEGLDALRAEGVFVGRLERFENNPFLGISRPYYEYTIEVRRY